MNASPYEGKSTADWEEITLELVDNHPLDMEHLKQVVLMSWEQILLTKIGPFQIGVDIFPSPQILGNFLHELIPLNLANQEPELWRREQETSDKDLVYIPDDGYSVEIKTSSNKDKIFGNRSFAQKSTAAKKSKSGYYLAVNFEKFQKGASSRSPKPKILKIRFGWIDEEDWHGQTAATGQAASLAPEVYAYKFIELY